MSSFLKLLSMVFPLLIGSVCTVSAQYGVDQPDGDEVSCPNATNTCCNVEGACNGPNSSYWNYDPDYSATGGCDLSCVIEGCTDETACNYDADATTDDGSCEYFSCATFGCTDDSACNFNASAQFEDGTCTFPPAGLDCSGDCLVDSDGDGVCDEDEISGCVDSQACDYDPTATDSVACTTYPEEGYDCDNNCLADVNSNGQCDYFETSGCTDSSACNFNPLATLESGACEFLSCAIYGCMNSGACNFNFNATHDDGSCVFPEEAYDCNGVCVVDTDADGTCDVFEVEGCTDADANNYNEDATESNDSCIYPTPPPEDFEFTPTSGSGLFIGQVTLDGVSASGEDWIAAFDSDGNCAGSVQLVVNEGVSYIQLVIYADDATTAGVDEGMSGSEPFSLQLFLASSETYIDYYGPLGQTDFNGWVSTNGAPIPAYSDPEVVYAFSTIAYIPDCLDIEACNYDPTSAGSSSCYFAESGYSCEGICLSDSDDDGVCDDFEVVGCQDAMACNYDALATDSDACEYAELGYDCQGACLLDADGDGTCDAFEINGCTDPIACNYDVEATENDAACSYPVVGYDCDGMCAADTDNDGVCDALEVLGCDDLSACDYDAAATENNGSCTYPLNGYDCSGSCTSDTDGDGVCDALEVGGCTDVTACNYNELATDEDGSCSTLDAIDVCGGDC